MFQQYYAQSILDYNSESMTKFVTELTLRKSVWHSFFDSH